MNTTIYTNLTTSNPGVWGPVTATLDWCEANYQFSPHVAEMANSFSNIITIAVALIGGYLAKRENLPARYQAGFSGFAFVGLGSFAFHATLLYTAQLADELPMIYTATYSLFFLFDTKPGYAITLRSRLLMVALSIFSVIFTLTYISNRNPIYHQAVFAFLVLSIAVRTTYLLRWSEAAKKIPAEKKALIAHFFLSGVITFATGFLVWNLDNAFCNSITRWKKTVGWPTAFLLEGHSWWHVLTGVGSYLKIVGILYLALCVKDDHRKYDIGHLFGFPYVKRVDPTKLKAT